MEFWNKLTYSHKTYILLGLLVLGGLFAYKRKIAGTLEQYHQLQELSNLKDEALIDREIQLQETELRHINKILGKDRKDLELINKEILNYVSLYCDSTDVELVNMPKAHQINQQEYRIYTHKVIVKGNFQELLPLAYWFETSTSGMKLASVEYLSVKDPRTKRTELFAELYIQSYENSK